MMDTIQKRGRRGREKNTKKQLYFVFNTHSFDMTTIEELFYSLLGEEKEEEKQGDTFRVLLARSSPTDAPKKLFVCCHGGGYTADSFTLLFQTLMQQEDRECIHALAYDARAHGTLYLTFQMRAVHSKVVCRQIADEERRR